MDSALPACLAAAVLAGFIQGFSGFGSVLVALPVLLAVLDLREAVPLVSLLALSINVVMATKLRGHIQFRSMRLLFASSLPGMAVGGWILEGAPDSLIKGLLGGAILFLVFHSLTSNRPRAALGTGWTLAAGFLSGCIGLTTGANGPPVIAWAARQPWARDELRATLTFYFLVTGAAIVGVQAVTGLATQRVLTLFGACLPAMLAGLWAGGACSGRVGEAGFRKAVLALLALIGLNLCWQAIAAGLAGR
ncbi:hypothetical protein NNJEOMEG_03585 [Fundidesulfovibrio magnetotacticus]|uniref:Probable membrane transporter protein n=1 Tax=Fundidesulfovibrio magnetotacticus TaxID=2730080 RepID=A0A6V8M1J6_9BACT|nr:sulfite exporter TauE/SafE family protein [Fundidesulfovibrio magnetotacticus]GFK95717.1 hypothetical protein NNJEOMEG_03585 [Fundidesulfovibrio magnetotacticus]